MDALIEAFGSYSIGSVIVLVAAFIFLYKIYRKAAQAIVEQHDTKKAQDEKIQKILDQESKYPEWRRQSIGVRGRKWKRVRFGTCSETTRKTAGTGICTLLCSLP